jgi:two-component system chemotaxis response regulator CheB
MERRLQEQQWKIVAIGSSAGGLEAICALLRQLPHDLPAAILVVTHRPPVRISHLQEVLSRCTNVSVVVPREDAVLRPAVCFLGTPDLHLTVGPALRLHLLPDAFYRTHNIDALFCSLALHAGKRTIGVILSGLLKDGTFGLKAIKEAGGTALVQSPEEAAWPDMPRNAIENGGPIDFVGPIDALAREIRRLVDHSSPASSGYEQD